MRIGVDIDDTIADTYDWIFNLSQKFTVEELHRSANLRVSSGLQTHMYFQEMHGWTQEETQLFLNQYYHILVQNIKPKMFAKEMMDQLKQEGNEIFLITARFPSEWFDIQKATLNWLSNHKIHYDKLFFYEGTKLQTVRENQVDVFLDDSFKHVKEMADNGVRTFIMDSRVNRGLDGEKVTRVYSWSHFYQEMARIKEEK